MNLQRYLSFDLDTTHKEFNRNYYSQITRFMMEEGFSWLKDSNYLSCKKLEERDIRRINKKFAKHFPIIVDCMTKFDWTVFKPEIANHSIEELKDEVKYSRARQKLEQCNELTTEHKHKR
ncbi:MAG: hypothetical protein LBF00_03005 [Mycoplasmataceae bacterium]|jgi:virulence-associated protein VapD|nr:hypothetical protein [Mycoplasmataceae bacterium]